MRHIFAVSKSDTNMQGAKSMQKYNETSLCRRYVTTLVANIYGVAADQIRTEKPYFPTPVLVPITTPCAGEPVQPLLKPLTF
jgi:hypothetical protein